MFSHLSLAASKSAATPKFAINWHVTQKDNMKKTSPSSSSPERYFIKKTQANKQTKNTKHKKPQRKSNSTPPKKNGKAHLIYKCNTWECFAAFFYSLSDSVNSPNFGMPLHFLTICVLISYLNVYSMCVLNQGFIISLGIKCTLSWLSTKLLFIYFGEKRYTVLKVSLGFEEQGVTFL